MAEKGDGGWPGAVKYGIVSALIVGLVVAFWDPLYRAADYIAGHGETIDTLKAGPLAIKLNTKARFPDPPSDISGPLVALDQHEMLFLLRRPIEKFDAVCIDQKSADPAAKPKHHEEHRTRARNWQRLAELRLADVRPATDPYAWCHGETQTFALTDQGKRAQYFLEQVFQQGMTISKRGAQAT